MPATVAIRTDYSGSELRRLAACSKDANQSRRLLSLAAVLDGMGRADAARIGGMDPRRCATGFIASTPKAQTGSRIFAPRARRRGSRRNNLSSSPKIGH
jgi:hypothetical protein